MNRFIRKPSFAVKIIQIVVSLIIGVFFLVLVGYYQEKIEMSVIIVVLFIVILFALIILFDYLEVLLSKKVKIILTDTNLIIETQKKETENIDLNLIDEICISLNNYESKLFLTIRTKKRKEYSIQLITFFLLGKRQTTIFLKEFANNYKRLEPYLDKESIKLTK